MRYFAVKNSPWLQKVCEYSENSNQVYEITSRYALELYKELSKPGQYNLVAVPNHKKGTLVKGKTFSVWGELMTPEERFKRRLNGTLGIKVLNKRIADE